MENTTGINAAHAGTLTLGKDITVNRMGYGAMRITGTGIWGWPKDKKEAIRVLRTAVDLGVNFIDTADSYGPYVSEEIIAEALAPYPTGLIIATKGGLTRSGPNQWHVNGHPDHLEEALKGSLQRLKLDQIDLYQLHRFDEKVPLEDTLGKLKDLQDAGYIRHLGVSEVSVEQLKQAAGMIDIVSVQNRFSLSYRKWDEEVKWCEAHGAAFIPWYPLDAGDMDNEILNEIAQKKGASVFQIALAWLLAHSPNMLPIPGTSSVNHLQQNIAASNIRLSAEEMAQLNEIGREVG